ncbi:hypothetical protein [Bremerella alba]|uniref:Uncharacterized protein n=1 Tax=Bremerella alba TaxID=980252 RepID=A0A7V9A8K8_9BACT|nr:hypothetical protein [Bremerella alba]MBA2116600.1 hypothetical protein [Bremerella alba]
MTDRLDVTNEPESGQPRQNAEQGRKSRPFLGVKFDCCSIYSRIYQNKDGTHYIGNCPKCAKQIRIRIGQGGSGNRFFTAY